MKNLANHSPGHPISAAAPVSLKLKIWKVFSRKPKAIIVILLSVSLLLQSQFINAQAPQQFSFQGVARKADGAVVANSPVQLKFSIQDENGGLYFEEQQTASTNAQGIFNVKIGAVNPITSVDWKLKSYFLHIEIDPTNTGDFTYLGATQLISVPFSLHSAEAAKLINDDPIIQTGKSSKGQILPPLGSNSTKLVWYPRNGSFRFGAVSGTQWDDAQNGNYSFAGGVDGTASGIYSAAFGHGTVAKAEGGFALGLFNDNTDAVGGIPRLFQVGNGFNENNRQNAITILANGNIGIGSNALVPQFLLDIGGRARIRNNGATAGIYLNNSANASDAFVGLVNDDEMGFYLGGAWRLVATKSGNVYAQQFINSSDKALKRDIFPLGTSLSKLYSVNGYHYYWKTDKTNDNLQTGVIAQEVEKNFPELVSIGKDGYKAVNYIGLIPHLIEAVKELDKKTDEIAALKKELASVQEMNKKLSALEASVKELLSGQAATSTRTSK